MFSPGMGGHVLPLLLVLIVAFLSYRSALPVSHKRRLDLNVGNHLLKVKVAETPYELVRGLLGSRILQENEGMLFVLPEGTKPNFHMKEMKMPLDIAFIDKHGVILDLQEMDPREENRLYPSSDKARYALEVHRGWFERRRVRKGDFVRPHFSSLSRR